MASGLLPGLTAAISAADQRLLWRSVRTIEDASLIGRFSALVGVPLNVTLNKLPAPLTAQVHRMVGAALSQALKAALFHLDSKATPDPGRAGFQVIGSLTGGFSGFFGLPAMALELPLTTTLMLRSIAAIARDEGEDLHTVDARMACLEVFALGAKESSAADTSYYATRAFLANTASQAARAVAERTAASRSAPVIVELINAIASRFGIVVSERIAASAIPVLGALGGAAVNLAFMDHFQKLAGAHFTIRRLERTYGKDAIQEQYRTYLAALRQPVVTE